jgi:hypothetical protein
MSILCEVQKGVVKMGTNLPRLSYTRNMRVNRKSGFGVPAVTLIAAALIVGGIGVSVVMQKPSLSPIPAPSVEQVVSGDIQVTTSLDENTMATNTATEESSLAGPLVPPSFQAASPLSEMGSSVVPPSTPTPQLGDVSLDTTPLICGGGAKWDLLRCYGAYYEELVRLQDPLVAMMNLKARYELDPFIKSECHQIAHVVGRSAAAKYPSVSEAYIRGDPACWSGYYHGVMEGVLASIAGGEKNLTAATLNSICTDVRKDPNDYSFNYYNCVHGIGHGVMYIRDNELFEALDLCALFTGAWEASSCAGGAFMENVIADEKNHFSKHLKSDDLFYPCNASSEQFKHACYLMHTSYMLRQTGSDFSRVFELCSQIEASYIDTCYQSLGRDASGRSISNVEATKYTCLLGKDFRQQSNCVIGAVKDFISYHHSDVQAKELCAALPADLQETCSRETTMYYSVF